jgi:fatty-acyl-CoA synthase
MKTTTPDIEKKLLDITATFLTESGEEFSQRKVALDASLQKHLGIDSLGRAELFSRIEKNFSVQLPQQLLAEANTLQDIVTALVSATPGSSRQPHSMLVPATNEVHIDPSSAKTLIDVLLLYAIQTPDRPHVYLQDEFGKEEVISYGKLLEMSLRVAHAYQQRGLRPGDTVAIMLPTCAGFFYAFFGALLAGCVPVPIYPPFRPHQIEAYAKQEAKILQNAEVRILVTFHQAENLSRLLRAFIPSLKNVSTVDSLLETTEKAPIYPRNGDDFALIQYTSGSTNTPKGVLLSHQNLLANIRTFGTAIAVSSKDVTISWAPLYHDLGLIGMWLGSLYHGAPLTLMSPLTFLTRPERWLWAMHYHRGTISGGPNFAYELCVRKIEHAQIEGLDLSSWRLAVNGAEAIQPKTLQKFTEKFARYGFRPEAHFPVYGLAESTVCVATSPLNRGPLIDVVERDALETKSVAIPVTDKTNKNFLEFVACGKAIPEHAMRVVNESGEAAPERHVGFIQFKGPSSMQGYYGNPEATQAIYHDGWWDTGDMGYLVDEEVYITGRKKDMIIKAGRNLYPAEIEELTSQVPDVRKGCVIAFGATDPERGTESLVVVAETHEKHPQNRETIIEKIKEIIIDALDIAPDHVVLVPPRTVPKTSSGKLQRSACKNAWLAGKLSYKSHPMWLQITKLGFSFTTVKLKNSLGNALKILYTAYLMVLFGLTIPIVWLSLWIISKKAAGHVCRIWARALTLLAFCPISISGKKNLHKHKTMIYTSNHASYIDALFMLAVVPGGTRLVGKKEILNIPILRTFMKKLSFIAVDRTNLVKGIEDTKEMNHALETGNSLLIFPEGTFSYAAGLRPFKLGAFKIAVETQTPICPIALQNTRAILRGEEKLFSPRRVNIIVGEPIMPSGNDWQAMTVLKNTTRTFIAEHCGEPTLDLIMTGVAAPRSEHDS